MKNNLPQKYNKGLLYKIKEFFRNLFNKPESKHITNEEISNYDISVKNNSITELREEQKKEQLKEDIVTQIDKNPSLIEKLSIERLKELDNIYVEKIKERDIEIANLEKDISNLKVQNA